MTEPLDTREAAQAYLDRVYRPGVRWSMHRFPHGWALRTVPVTPAEIEQARQPGKTTLVLEESTGRITSHGPFPPSIVIKRYLAAVAAGKDPGGAQIYPELPPPDPRPNAERLAPTSPDGTATVHYFLDHYQGFDRPASGVTVLVSGPRGHRSITPMPSQKKWVIDSVNYLAQDRYVSILRPVGREEAADLLLNRMAVTLPDETEFLALYRRR